VHVVAVVGQLKFAINGQASYEIVGEVRMESVIMKLTRLMRSWPRHHQIDITVKRY
jgi:hypothetical protein